MSEIVNLYPQNSEQKINNKLDEIDFVDIAENILIDTRAELKNKATISMPIEQIATLGAGVASLLPIFRTITETTTVGEEGLYRLANAEVGEALKAAKNGNFWGSIKCADGKSKMAQLQSVGKSVSTTTTTMPIDPATIMMAIALYSIEQKLDAIAKMEKQILDFLEIEKESEIEADIETLSSMMGKYKYNWDNEHFIASNHKLVIDIQRTSRKHMNAYKKQVEEVISSKKFLVSQSKVNNTLNDLLKKFKYYRLTMYTFSLASFIEIMLSGDFKEENIILVKDEIEKLSLTYREIFSECSVFLEKLSTSSIETNLIKGTGAAGKFVGKFIDSIPKIREGQVDEYLLEKGTKLQNNAEQIERKTVEAFAEISNPEIWVFIEKLNDLIQIYCKTEQICFDDKNIYLIAG